LPVEERRVISDQISAIRRQEKAYAEGTESAEVAERRRGTEVSDRKSPPFIPKRHRDGAEVAKGAKDGAPSSTWMGGAS
jgi:hypothetical protein